MIKKIIASLILLCANAQAMDSNKNKQLIPNAAYHILKDKHGKQILPYESELKEYQPNATDLIETVTYFSADGDEIVTKPVKIMDQFKIEIDIKPTAYFYKYEKYEDVYVMTFYDKNGYILTTYSSNKHDNLNNIANERNITLSADIEEIISTY